MVFVVPSQIPEGESELAEIKKDLKNLILPAFALCGHMNWIFAVNKIDLVNYSEKGAYKQSVL
mgnify:CR=1 FL=1